MHNMGVHDVYVFDVAVRRMKGHCVHCVGMHGVDMHHMGMHKM
jgi:hypothetical protein